MIHENAICSHDTGVGGVTTYKQPTDSRLYSHAKPLSHACAQIRVHVYTHIYVHATEVNASFYIFETGLKVNYC